MKKVFGAIRLLFFLLLCGSANGDIIWDETFDDQTPFTDLRYTAGSVSKTSFKGINIFRSSGARDAGMVYDSKSSLTQGRLFSFSSMYPKTDFGNHILDTQSAGSEISRCWLLEPDQHLFWGESGNPNIPSGSGRIIYSRADTAIAQAALAFRHSTAQKANGTLVGSVIFHFGGSGSRHTLKYNMVCMGNGTISIQEIRDGSLARSIGCVFGNTWSQLTTVWASHSSKDWKTGNPAKGWLAGTQITSPALTCIYTFVNVNPIGEPKMPAAFADDPWILQDPGPDGTKIHTVRYAAGSNDPMLLDNLYLEIGMRGDAVAQHRLHAFNEAYPDLPTNINLAQ